jgi:peptidyl-prolyl cis-trans isomerase C
MTLRSSKRARAIACAAVLSLGGAVAATRAQEAAPKPAKPPAAAKTGTAAKAGKAAPSTPAADPNDPAEIKRRAQPIATYNGGQVTVGDLEDAITHQSAFMRGRYHDVENLKELLDKTLRFSLMADEAARRGIDKEPGVREAVKQNSVQRLIKTEFDDKQSPESIPKADVEAYYKEHIDEYVQPALQRAALIVVASEKEAQDILAQVKTADLRTFHQLARDKSLDQATKTRGGDLRFFDATGKLRGEPPGTAPLPLVKAAFALKTIGDVAPKPIKTEQGYAVLKLTGSRAAISRKLADVEESIRVRLWRDQRQKNIDAFVAALRTQYKPELHAELVDAIVLQDTPGNGLMAPVAPAPGAAEAPKGQEPSERP